jgi:phosphonate transport system substrate-binding protein
MSRDLRNGLRSRNRRRLIGAALAAPVAARAGSSATLRFGTTPVFLDDQISLLTLWQAYLERHLQQSVRFVQRANYRGVLDGLLDESIDVAWLCGFPYVAQETRLSLVAVPVYEGVPLYRSYLIVPNSDTATKSIVDLGKRVFAFSDPLSNSGHLVPSAELVRAHLSAESHFRRTFFTYSHRKVVEAVQAGVADAGSVDGYVWDTLAIQLPKSTVGVRIAWRSPTYGFPPIVSRRSLGDEPARRLAETLVAMKGSDDGRKILERLNLDGFAVESPALFDGVRQLVGIVQQVRR